MKKLMIAAAIVCAAVMSQAASFEWKSTAKMYGSDLTTLYTGKAVLHCVELGDTWSLESSFNNGTLVTKATDDKFTGGNWYNFFFTVEDNGKTFTSVTKSFAAPTTATPGNATFGNMETASKTSGNWAAAPEPTSGLLLLLGVAGLALRRRRA